MKYRVIKEYRDAPRIPVRVVKGEKLTFIEESDPLGDWPNWVFCRGENKEGWIPNQILEISNGIAVCISDYSAREHNLSPGEILIMIDSLNGWIWCYKEKDKENPGWAPLNHLKKLD